MSDKLEQIKKEILAEFIEVRVQSGYDITEFMGKPLEYFDYEKLKNQIEWHKENCLTCKK